MKSLEELCLSLISRSITDFSSRLGTHLSLRHKEMLLERLSWHGLFSFQLLPTISYHLFSSSLQHINLSHSDQINDKSLELLGLSQCQPLSFSLTKCINITDKGVESLSKLSFFINMEYLKLSKLKNLIGTEGFQRVGSKSVKSLILKGCSRMIDKGVIDIVRRCSSASFLDLSEIHKLTDESIAAVAETLRDNLEELNCSEISGLTCASTGLLATYCHNIKRADFEGCVKLDGSGLTQMAENCTLEQLSISFCYKVLPLTVDTLISTLNAKGKLKSLNLMAVTFGDFTTEFISSCHHLTHLYIAGILIKDKDFETLCSNLGNVLEELDISGCPLLTDESLCKSMARHLKCIEYIGMRNMKDTTGMYLKEIFKDPVRAANIHYIAFSGSKEISPEVVELIATHCPNIETLLLAGLRGINDEIAYLLADNCPHLSHCSLRNCSLTDDGVCQLVISCKKLVMIALAGIHDLTDQSIIALANNCPHLDEIHLSGCAKITKQALAFLSDSVIGPLWINHNVPNAPPGLLMAKDLDTGKYERVVARFHQQQQGVAHSLRNAIK